MTLKEKRPSDFEMRSREFLLALREAGTANSIFWPDQLRKDLAELGHRMEWTQEVHRTAAVGLGTIALARDELMLLTLATSAALEQEADERQPLSDHSREVLRRERLLYMYDMNTISRRAAEEVMAEAERATHPKPGLIDTYLRLAGIKA